MEVIQIKDGKDKIVLYLEGNKITGKRFKPDNTIEAIDKSVLNYFDVFQLSNNRTPLDNEGEYQVILDKNTNFKHYFKDGVEDFEMFFYNNGEDATCYAKDDSKKGTRFVARFALGTLIITLALSAFQSLAPKGPDLEVAPPSKDPAIVSAIDNRITAPLTREWMYERILSTSGMTNSQKNQIYENRALFDVALEQVKKSEYQKELLRRRLNEIRVERVAVDAEVDGYYTGNNVIYVKDDENIVHEFLHAFHPDLRLNLVREGVLRRMEEESRGVSEKLNTPAMKFFDDFSILAGRDALLEYTFTGEESAIENALKPYLDDTQYEDLVAGLVDYENAETLGKARKSLNLVAGKKHIDIGQGYIEPKYDETIDAFRYEGIYDEDQCERCRLGLPFDIKEPLEKGLVKVLKYDFDNHTYAGEATYEELVNGERDDNIVGYDYSFVIVPQEDFGWEDAFIDISKYRYYVGKPQVLVEPTLRKKVGESFLEAKPDQIRMSYDEFVKEGNEPTPPLNYLSRWYSEYEDRLVPKSTKQEFTYPNGAYVKRLDNNRILWRDEKGKEETYDLPESAKLHVFDDGYIVWTTPADIQYRRILPNGNKDELYLIGNEKYTNDAKGRYVIESSTGTKQFLVDETRNKWGPIATGFQIGDGKKEFGYVHSYFNENGEIAGTQIVDADRVEFIDTSGNITLFADSYYDAPYLYVREAKENGNYDLKYSQGNVAHYDAFNNLVGADYANGCKFVLDGLTYKFYDQDGNLTYSRPLDANDEYVYDTWNGQYIGFQKKNYEDKRNLFNEERIIMGCERLRWYTDKENGWSVEEELGVNFNKEIISVEQFAKDIEAGKIKIKKYDKDGKYIEDISTYDESIVRGIHDYDIEIEFVGNNNYMSFAPRYRNGEIIGFALTEKGNEDRVTSFEELAAMHKLTPLKDTMEEYGFDIDKEAPESDKRHFDYPNGSTVDILDDNTVVRRENGKEERYALDPHAKLHIYDNGLIQWQLDAREFSILGTYRAIYPDGVLWNQYMVCDKNNIPTENNSDIICTLSTGETYYLSDGYIESYTTADGRTIITPNTNLRFDVKNEKGEKIGTRETWGPVIIWTDNNGTSIMNSYAWGAPGYFRTRFENADGSYDWKYTNGVVEHNTKEGVVSSIDYPNGRSVELDGNTVKVKDENGELVETLTSEMVGAEYDPEPDTWAPEAISFYADKDGVWSYAKFRLYFGRYKVIKDTNYNITSFEDIKAPVKELNNNNN